MSNIKISYGITAYKEEWIESDHFLNAVNTGKKIFILYEEASQ